MKLGPVAKLDKKNEKTSRKLTMTSYQTNCDTIVIFPIYDQFGAIRKPASGRIACKTYIFINSPLLSYKN